LAPTVVKLDEQQLDALRAQYADEVRAKLAQGSDKHVEELVPASQRELRGAEQASRTG
jgi:hypothetical protein